MAFKSSTNGSCCRVSYLQDEAAAAGTAPGITRGGADGAAVAGPAAAAAAAGGAAGTGPGSAVAAAASRGAGGGGALDEEDERQLWKWRVELCVLQALDTQTSLKQEVSGWVLECGCRCGCGCAFLLSSLWGRQWVGSWWRGRPDPICSHAQIVIWASCTVLHRPVSSYITPHN